MRWTAIIYTEEKQAKAIIVPVGPEFDWDWKKDTELNIFHT